jgi:signal transduction histidine kinase
MIEGDPLRWEQVLQNLMLNALQASDAGGRVVVGSSTGKIWIEDQGCGMTEEQLEKLFTPFFTNKPQGTGLGMSTVKKILDAHDARIHVESKVNQGTRIEIELPLRRAA